MSEEPHSSGTGWSDAVDVYQAWASSLNRRCSRLTVWTRSSALIFFGFASTATAWAGELLPTHPNADRAR